MTIVYQTKLCFQLCKQIRLLSISAAVKLSSALGFVPFVHSSVGLGCSRICYTIRKDKRALHAVGLRYLAFAISVTLPLYHLYLFS